MQVHPEAMAAIAAAIAALTKVEPSAARRTAHSHRRRASSRRS